MSETLTTELLSALKGVVEWHGKRHADTSDALLPADQQDPEIAEAMRVIAKAEGSAMPVMLTPDDLTPWAEGDRVEYVRQSSDFMPSVGDQGVVVSVHEDHKGELIGPSHVIYVRPDGSPKTDRFYTLSMDVKRISKAPA